VRLARQIQSSEWFDHTAHLLPLLECLLADPAPPDDEREAVISMVVSGMAALVDEMSPEDCLSLLNALSRARFAAPRETVDAIDQRLATPAFRERMRTTPDLSARLAEARERLREP
jgi:hypothetical protein